MYLIKPSCLATLYSLHGAAPIGLFTEKYEIKAATWKMLAARGLDEPFCPVVLLCLFFGCGRK
jgi:hypothetical protein